MGTKEILNAFGKMEEAYFEAENKKKGRGRPKKQEPVMTTNIRIETDLYEWLVSEKERTGVSINQIINNIIRKEAGL